VDKYGKALSDSFVRIYESRERVDGIMSVPDAVLDAEGRKLGKAFPGEVCRDLATRRVGYRLEVYLNIRDLLSASHDIAFAIVYGATRALRVPRTASTGG